MGQKFGQHFLVNHSILERISRAVCPDHEALVVEIGPGKGALTAKLLERADRVVAIEIDPAMVEHLRRRFAGESRLQIVEADILTTDLHQWRDAPIAGNLPYYITSPIVAMVVRSRAQRAVFLVQKEVADRLSAAPGSRDYGFLTVSTQVFCQVRKLFDVKPGAFQPPPKVDSAVVELLPTTGSENLQFEDFIEFIGRCFRHKRKTLRNNLAAYYGLAVNSWPEAHLRAEQIPLDQFRRMFDRLHSAELQNSEHE